MEFEVDVEGGREVARTGRVGFTGEALATELDVGRVYEKDCERRRPFAGVVSGSSRRRSVVS